MEEPILLRFISLATAVLATGCDSPKRNASETYTLYRNSPPTDLSMRLHVATFDAVDTLDYNRDMCEIVRKFFTEQPFMGARYWCEAGKYREKL